MSRFPGFLVQGLQKTLIFIDNAMLILRDKPERAFLEKMLADLKKEGSFTYETIFYRGKMACISWVSST